MEEYGIRVGFCAAGKPVELLLCLAIARHLFQVGVDQSHVGEPLAALAILPWHDAIEIFLQAALEHKKATLTKPDFLAYWPALAEKDVPLTRREQMNRFNRARVSLKHHGTLPARMQVEEFRGNVSDFLEENVATVFDIKFDEISLSGLVRTESVRSVRASENWIRIGDHGSALVEAAQAFHLTLQNITLAASKSDRRTV